MVSNVALWNRIACFTPDDPQAEFRFTDRLARENGWSTAFAKGAVGEYKRFVYLAAISERHVTPSDVVDQVWHLHLTFTRSYWNDLCRAVLQQELHHMPTKGGRAEAARYREQYDATLALYRLEFGEDAPAAFWPEPRARFSSLVHHAWVDRRSHWVIAKPDWRGWIAGLGALIASLGVAGVASAADGDKDGAGTTTIVIGAAVAAALLLLGLTMGQSRRPRRRSKDDGGGDAGFVATIGGGGGSSGSGKGKGHDGGEGGEGGGEGGGGEGGGGDGGGGGCGGGGCSG